MGGLSTTCMQWNSAIMNGCPFFNNLENILNPLRCVCFLHSFVKLIYKSLKPMVSGPKVHNHSIRRTTPQQPISIASMWGLRWYSPISNRAFSHRPPSFITPPLVIRRMCFLCHSLMKKTVGVVAVNQHNDLGVVDIPNQLQSLRWKKKIDKAWREIWDSSQGVGKIFTTWVEEVMSSHSSSRVSSTRMSSYWSWGGTYIWNIFISLHLCPLKCHSS